MAGSANSLARSGEPLTVIDAYRAMVAFLETCWERGNRTGDLASVLSDISLETFADIKPADPAQWGDWLHAIDRTR